MTMRKRTIISFALLLYVLASCQNDDPPVEEGKPLSFSIQQTRAGLSSLFEDFKVWGSCTVNDAGTTIMPGYRVNYDPTAGWTYSLGEGTESQTLQYWNLSASMYRFHAGAPVSKVKGIAESSLILDMKATTTLSETCLYSQPREVKRTDAEFGDVVNLNFVYANARVNLSFKYLSDTSTSITGIRLTPPSPYATAATLQMDYNWTYSAAYPGTLDITAQSSDALTFPDIDIPANASEAVTTAIPWYMIPDPSTAGKWKLSITIGGETKEVEFTIGEPWQPGRSYVYRFEYTTEANLIFTGTATELFVGESPENGGEHYFN